MSDSPRPKDSGMGRWISRESTRLNMADSRKGTELRAAISSMRMFVTKLIKATETLQNEGYATSNFTKSLKVLQSCFWDTCGWAFGPQNNTSKGKARNASTFPWSTFLGSTRIPRWLQRTLGYEGHLPHYRHSIYPCARGQEAGTYLGFRLGRGHS